VDGFGRIEGIRIDLISLCICICGKFISGIFFGYLGVANLGWGWICVIDTLPGVRSF